MMYTGKRVNFAARYWRMELVGKFLSDKTNRLYWYQTYVWIA